MKPNPFRVLLVGCLTASAAVAEPFHLLHERTGQLHGPYDFRDGAKVVIGSQTFTLLKTPPLSVLDRLHRTVIPELQLRQATGRDAIEFLRQASVEYSPTGDRVGVNLILNVPEGACSVPRITCNATRLTLHEALKVIADIERLVFRVEGNYVMIVPRKE